MQALRKTKRFIGTPDLETTIAGIPCQCIVTSWGTYEPQTYWHPGCEAEIEFDVYDRKGYIAEWLYKKLTDKDIARICEELKESRRGDYGDF